MTLRSGCLFLCATLLTSLSANILLADVTPDQRKEIESIKTTVRKAGNLYLQKKFADSGEEVRDAQARVEKLAATGDKAVLAQLEYVYKSLLKAHALLELEGVDLPKLMKLEEMSAKPEDDKPAAGGAVSFKTHVAPILMSRCGRCHVNNARGMFSMANYKSLMKGPPAGFVVKPGDLAGSRLIEAVEGKEMPPNGSGIPAADLDVLKKWVTEGAKYDGGDPEATLASLAPNANANAPMAQVVQATGKETISFAKDIAPVLNEKCANCHGNGNRPSGRFNLTTFTGLLRGGENGEPILPGKSADSLLIRKLKGTAEGEQMPRGGPPLPADTIAKIEKWIMEGATFDGPDAGQHIREVAALAKAQSSSHDELSADRKELAVQNWRLGMPGIESSETQTENFLLIGNVGEATLADYGKQAEEIAPKVAAILKAPAGEPLVKGRMTLYFFPQRYDYSEFGKMVERRQIPRAWRGHWIYSVVDAYGAIIPPRGDEYTVDGLVGQQLAGTYVASLGKSPRWFAEGSARMVASRIAPEDPRVIAWDEQLSEVIGKMSKPDDFLTGKLPPEFADIASYSYVKFLMKDGKKYDALLNALRDGKDFTKTFSSTYGGSPEQVADYWARSAVKSSRKSSRR